MVVLNGLINALKRSFYAINQAYTGGVSVAAVDLNGDGVDDIICGAMSINVPPYIAVTSMQIVDGA